MKLVHSLTLIFGFSFVSISCMTMREPKEHVKACHGTDGALSSSPECVAAHNEIVQEKQGERAQRSSLKSDSGGRYNR